MTIADLVNKADVSVRLRNVINSAAEQQRLPFETVGDFLSAGWDYEKNGKLTPEEVAAGSASLEIWLKCPIDGCSWKKRPNDITTSWERGRRGCPVCARKTKKAEKQPTLFAIYPEFVSQYWDYSKNDALGLNPVELTLASNRKVWFKCPHDGHEWEARRRIWCCGATS